MVWIPLALLLVVPLVVVYFIIIRAMDRYSPAPWWQLIVCILWGAVGAALLSVGLDLAGQWLIAQMMDRPMDSEPVIHATATFVAPPVEEAAKALGLLAIYLFSKRRVPESHGPLSGVVYGGIIGLGFTLTEDVIYIAQMSNAQGAGAGAALFFVRTILLGFGHASFTAFVGLGFGLWAVMSSGWRWVMPLAGLAVGMAFHAGRNLFASYLILKGAGLLVVLLLQLLMFGILVGLLVWLARRDRQQVMAGLQGLIGTLITRAEYDRITSPWMLMPGWTLFTLTGLPGGYQAAREKQTHLYQLAFIRQRSISANGPPVVDPLEAEAIAAIQLANARGVRLAPEPVAPMMQPPVMR